MAYLAADAPVTLTKISSSLFGQRVVDNQADHETRMLSVEARAALLEGTYARYISNGTGLGVINSAGNATWAFATAVTTTTSITASGTNNTTFTVQRAGIWTIAFGLRWKTNAAVAAGGDYYGWGDIGGVEFVGSTEKNPNGYAIDTFFVKNMTTVRRFSVGNAIQFKMANSTAQAIGQSNAGEAIFCAFKWMGP